MKKIFFIITTLFAAFLSSCTQEEVVNNPADNRRVSLSAELPGTIANTRAQISVPVTHKLRCILEVWTRGAATSTLAYRGEQAVEAGGIPTFNFELDPGDYSFLMWADFIEKDAATEELTIDNGVVYTHYEDLFYDTSDLKNITMKDAAAMFDTDLCDAFFLKEDVDKSDESIVRTLRMNRPFAKLIAVEKNDADYAKITGISVSYTVPAGFNVSTGEPLAGTVTAGYTKETMESDENVLFTNYIFTPSVGGYALPVASFTLNSTEGNVSCEMAASSVTLSRNHQVRAVGAFLAGGTVIPEPEPEPDRDPMVGDYFFIDGTWSSELTADNQGDCIGIVYAVGAQEGDDIANYGIAATDKKILGYVMALKNIPAKSYGFTEDNAHGITDRPYLYLHDVATKDVITGLELFTPATSVDKTNHDGIVKTKALLESSQFIAHSSDMSYPALQILNNWKADQVSVLNASEWYIPSVAQLWAAAGGCYGVASQSGYPEVTKVDALNMSFLNAIDAGIAEAFSSNASGGYYVYTSCLTTGSGVCFAQINRDGTAFKPKENDPKAAQGLIRPVLTIIK